MATEIFDPTRGTSEPGRYWTSTNLGEATPEVLSPMCLTAWAEQAELGWLGCMNDFGVLPKSKVVASPDVNDRGLSVFFGRQALNVDAIREVTANLPGVDPDDFERDLMGSLRDEAPQFKGNPFRIPVIAVKAPMTLLRISPEVRRKHDELLAWWRRDVFDGQHEVADPLERLIVAQGRFLDVFRPHTGVRFIFQALQSAVASAAESADDPTLATRLMSGVGMVNETQMSDDMWRFAQGEIDEKTFLRSWGYHGPNEGNLYTVVWREDPVPVRSLAQSTARRSDSERPRDRAERARQAAAEAEKQLMDATPVLRRGVVRFLLNRMRGIVRTLHLGKSGYLMAIDGCRAAARDFGAEQVAAGTLDETDDVFLLTLDECRQLACGALPNVEEIVTVRRANREVYKAQTLPLKFYGIPEPVALEGDSVEPVRELSGLDSGGGQVEGRARVVTDPAADVDLDDGDILVCRFTDPSWAPVMSLAEALVIDIGSSASHGAVVARELGIPYVIGTSTGTTTIRDGDRLVVDGSANLVTIVGRDSEPHAPSPAAFPAHQS